MIKPFSLPDLGEGVHEAEILAVQVSVGQDIKEGEVILEIETDKAAVEIPSPFTGTVKEVLVQPGDLARVGDVMLTVEGDQKSQQATPQPSLPESAKGTASSAETIPAPRADSGPVPASPATRRLARGLGVDLHLIPPTGSGGVVSGDDVRLFAEKGDSATAQQAAADTTVKPHPTTKTTAVLSQPSALPDFTQWGEIERQPFRSVRRTTAIQMATSWMQIPHVTCQDTVDISKLDSFRRKHKAELEAIGGRLTMTVFAMKAAATALKNFPHFNASLDLENQEIIVKKYFHIGVAVDTGHGLVVPVIRDVDRKSIKEISVELHQSIDKTRSRKISRNELVGGTFTITNAGALGGSFFSPIINHPEVAILGLGQARMQPWVVTDSDGDHEVVPRLILPIMLCFDHRVVDGADAIRFLKQVIDSLEDPDELLITMT